MAIADAMPALRVERRDGRSASCQSPTRLTDKRPLKRGARRFAAGAASSHFCATQYAAQKRLRTKPSALSKHRARVKPVHQHRVFTRTVAYVLHHLATQEVGR
jgi:hypothetical protein